MATTRYARIWQFLTQTQFSRGQIAVAVLLLFVSALSLVYSRYQARVLFAQLEKLQVQSRELESDRAALEAMRARLVQRQRVDEWAKTQLGMEPITTTKTQIYELAPTINSAQQE